jgi:hypothetical protein
MRFWWRIGKGITVALACVGWFVPASPLAASDGVPPGGATVVWDARLDEQGTLTGRWLDDGHRPLANRPVALQQAGRLVAATRTDGDGVFRLLRVRGGVYQVVLGGASATVRVWTAAAAPPAAARELVLVAPAPPVVRGQQPLAAVLTNPLFIGVVVAAAVAIPLAIYENDDGS